MGIFFNPGGSLNQKGPGVSNYNTPNAGSTSTGGVSVNAAQHHLVSSFNTLDPQVKAKLLTTFQKTDPAKYQLLSPHANTASSIAPDAQPSGIGDRFYRGEKALGSITKKAAEGLISGGLDLATGSGGQSAGEQVNRLAPTKANPSGKVVNFDGGRTNSFKDVVAQGAENSAITKGSTLAARGIVKLGGLALARSEAGQIATKAVPAQLGHLNTVLTTAEKEAASRPRPLLGLPAGKPKTSVDGPGFTMSAKADPFQIQRAKSLQTLDRKLNNFQNGRGTMTPQEAKSMMKQRNTIASTHELDHIAQLHSESTGIPKSIAHSHLASGDSPLAQHYQAVKNSPPRTAYDLPKEGLPTSTHSEPTIDPGSPTAHGKSSLLTGPKGSIQKGIRSGEGLLRSMGEPGKKLVRMMDNQVGDESAIANHYHKQIPTVMHLSKDEGKNLFDVVEKGATPVSGKVTQAAKEWQNLSRQILADSRAHGRTVGDQGENYMPHDFSDVYRSNSSRNAAAKEMVKRGEAKSEADALEQIRQAQKAHTNGKKFGNFDKARENNSTLYKRDTSVLHDYVNGAAKAISHDRHYGTDYGKAKDLISQITRNGHDGDHANYIFNRHVGEEKPQDNAAWRGIRTFEGGTKLGRASISNLTQVNNTQAMTGTLRTAKAAFHAVRRTAADDKFLDDAGVTGRAVEKVQAQQGGMGNKVSKVLMPFFNQVESFNRRTGALAGRGFGDAMAKKAAAGDKHAMTMLKDVLGVEGDIGSKLTYEQQVQAARGVVKHTQFLIGSKDLPDWATRSGAGRTVTQFRSFSYKQQQFIVDQVLKPAGHGDFAPLARYIAGTALLGTAAYKTRSFVNQTSHAKDSQLTKGLNIVQAAGGFGVAGDSLQNFLESASYDHPGSAEKTLIALSALVGGPAASDLAAETADVAKVAQGGTYAKNTLEKNLVRRAGPLGPAMAKSSIFDKTNVSIPDSTFKAMNGADKINYILKTPAKNLDKLDKSREVKSLLTMDKTTLDKMLNPPATQTKNGTKGVTVDQVKQALSRLGYNDTQKDGLLKTYKADASAKAKAARKQPKFVNPLR